MRGQQTRQLRPAHTCRGPSSSLDALRRPPVVPLPFRPWTLSQSLSSATCTSPRTVRLRPCCGPKSSPFQAKVLPAIRSAQARPPYRLSTPRTNPMCSLENAQLLLYQPSVSTPCNENPIYASHSFRNIPIYPP